MFGACVPIVIILGLDPFAFRILVVTKTEVCQRSCKVVIRDVFFLKEHGYVCE